MDKKLKRLRELKLLKFALEGLCTLKEISEMKKKRVRSCSVKEINRDRNINGFFKQTFLKMKEIDHQQFFSYTRMTPQVYQILLNLITPFLHKNSVREPVQPECRLALTLLYLAQGNSFQSLACSFKLGKETVRKIILETSEALWSKLSSVCVAEPSEEDYKKIAEDFWDIWDIPNCVGSIDGKHIAIQCPPTNEHRLFKNASSIALIAACDARYRFTHIDIGDYGHQTDEGIFQSSQFGKRLLKNELTLPPSKNLPNTQIKIPHFFVGSTACPLGISLMRPFPDGLLTNDKAVFNKSISRALGTIDNAFGILVTRWRVLLTSLHLYPENAKKIILSCIALHNFIILNDNEASYIPNNYVDWQNSNGDIQAGLWRSDVGNNIQKILPSSNMHHYGGPNSTQIRYKLCSFFEDFKTHPYLKS